MGLTPTEVAPESETVKYLRGSRTQLLPNGAKHFVVVLCLIPERPCCKKRSDRFACDRHAMAIG
jgi:hypothetical protein